MTDPDGRGQRAAGARRVRPDPSWQRFDGTLLAGSPLLAFRTTEAGGRVLDAIERGECVGVSPLVDRLLDAGAVHPVPASTATTFSVADVTVVTPQLGGVVADDDRIVVDDGSVPPLDGATIRLERNRGPAAARNAARPLVDTPLIAFVDADVDVSAGSGTGPVWLDRLLAHFDDPAVGAVAPRVLGERRSPLDLGDVPARIRAGTRVSYVPAAALVVRAAAFDDVGGFDETLRFGEDVDLVWRLDEAGWRCRYEPAATVRHAPRPTVGARLRQHAGYGTSAAPLALRHPRNLSPVHANGWTAAVWAAVVAGHPVAAVVLAAGTALRLPRRLPGVPAERAVRLALEGHARAGRQFADAVRRVWWPPVVVAAFVSRRARRVLVAAALVAPRTVATDVAYGWGVWTGVVRHRTFTPLLPRWRRWPGPTR